MGKWLRGGVALGVVACGTSECTSTLRPLRVLLYGQAIADSAFSTDIQFL